jgi:hypothetical protein
VQWIGLLLRELIHCPLRNIDITTIDGDHKMPLMLMRLGGIFSLVMASRIELGMYYQTA